MGLKQLSQKQREANISIKSQSNKLSDMIRSLMHNMEVNGKLDNDLCEKFMQSLFSKKYARSEYISSSEFDHENLAVTILLASGEYKNAYMLVRWIGD